MTDKITDGPLGRVGKRLKQLLRQNRSSFTMLKQSFCHSHKEEFGTVSSTWSQLEDAEMGIKTQRLVHAYDRNKGVTRWCRSVKLHRQIKRWIIYSQMSSAAFHLAVITSVFWQKCDSHAFYDSAMPMSFHLAFKMQVRRSFGQGIKDNNIFLTDSGKEKGMWPMLGKVK